jgi:hypothetical protein
VKGKIMAISNKNVYPKAIPCHSPEELALQNYRLNQLNEELAAQTKRLTQWNADLATRAAWLRRWTVRLIGTCVILLLLAVGTVAVVLFIPGRPMPSNPALVAQDPPAAKDAPIAAPVIDAKKAPLELPAMAIAKPDAGADQKAGYLEALGGLSATHLYQSHLNIGFLADGVESETYTVQDASKNLQAIVEMKLADLQLAKVVKSGLDPEDQDSIRQIRAVTGLLQLQATSLRAYWTTGDMDQAELYHKARKAASLGIAKVMGTE